MKKYEVQLSTTYKVIIDEFNHSLFRYQEGGKALSNGKVTQSKWVNLESYHPNMVQAIEKVLKLLLLERLDQQEYVSLDSYLNELREQTTAFLDEVKESLSKGGK